MKLDELKARLAAASGVAVTTAPTPALERTADGQCGSRLGSGRCELFEGHDGPHVTYSTSAFDNGERAVTRAWDQEAEPDDVPNWVDDRAAELAFDVRDAMIENGHVPADFGYDDADVWAECLVCGERGHGTLENGHLHHAADYAQCIRRYQVTLHREVRYLEVYVEYVEADSAQAAIDQVDSSYTDWDVVDSEVLREDVTGVEYD